MQASKAKLGARFKIKYLGDLSQPLGMHVTHDKTARSISIDQSKYVKDIRVKHNMYDCKPSSLPMMEHGFLSGLGDVDSPHLTCVAKDVYPSMLGSLQYVVVCTRPGICTTLSILNSGQANPTDAHLQALKKVVHYLKGTIEMRLTLGGYGPHPPNHVLRGCGLGE
jgi:hypothetical protein